MRVAGTFHFDLYRAGQLLEHRSVPNLVVNTGFAAVAGLIIQTGSTSPFTTLAIGQSTQAAASTDVELYAEISSGGGGRVVAALSRVTTDVTNDTPQLQTTFTFTTGSTTGFAITEAGVFTSTSSGAVMLCRQTFAAISVVATDTLQLTYKMDLD